MVYIYIYIIYLLLFIYLFILFNVFMYVLKLYYIYIYTQVIYGLYIYISWFWSFYHFLDAHPTRVWCCNPECQQILVFFHFAKRATLPKELGTFLRYTFDGLWPSLLRRKSKTMSITWPDDTLLGQSWMDTWIQNSLLVSMGLSTFTS